MAFTQATIVQVQQASAYQCCRCRSIGIEVHHIIPQKDKGSDTFENAAPLCPNCHSWFEDNPVKRKEITQMRDWWYGVVKQMYAPMAMDFKILNEINTKVEAIGSNQDRALEELKDTLIKVATDAIEKITPGTARITASGIANGTVFPGTISSPPSSQGGQGGEVYIFSRKVDGAGTISANGGEGDIGGVGGKVHIVSDDNQFKGNISADGGKSTRDKK